MTFARLAIQTSCVVMASVLATPRRVDLQSAPPRRSLQEVYSIPIVRGGDGAALQEVSWISVSRDNRAFIGDGAAGRILVVDSVGTLSRESALDREALPAEFSKSDGGALCGDSALCLWDATRGRVARISLRGEPAQIFAVPRRSYQSNSAGLVFASRDDRIWLRAIAGRMPGMDFWFRYTLAGSLVDSVPIPNARHGWPTPDGVRWPFTGREVSAPNFDGELLIGDPTHFEVRANRPGSLPVISSREFSKSVVRPEEAQEWLAILDGDERFPSNGVLPSTKPAFRSLRTDLQGRIWLERYVTAVVDSLTFPLPDGARRRRWREPSVFDVFSAQGELLFSVELPEYHELVAMHGDRLWALRTTSKGRSLVSLALASQPKH